MTTSLFLIRHAETMWNREGRMQGFKDSPLTEKGTQQATALAKKLTALRIDAFFSSDAPRCVSTMRLATGPSELPLTLMPDLRERNLGDWEGRRWVDIAAKDPNGTHLYRSTADYRPPQGETMLELRNRMLSALVDISRAHEGRRAAVFTSGGSIRAAVFGLLDLDVDGWARITAWNTGVTRLELTDGIWKLLTFNDISHLSA
jgi:broad specificity phosphatase PhoE